MPNELSGFAGLILYLAFIIAMHEIPPFLENYFEKRKANKIT